MVLFAFAKADQKKQVQVSEAIDAAFHSLGIFPDASRFPSKPRAGAAGTDAAAIPMNIVMGEDVLSPARVKDDLERIHRELEQTLSNQVATHTVSMKMGRDGLVISLREAGFFDSGSATPKPQTRLTLDEIAAAAGTNALRSAHRGPHRQRSHPHRRSSTPTGNSPRPAPRSIARLFIGHEDHRARPHLRRRLCRVSSRGQQRHRRGPRGEPPRGSGVLPRTKIDLSVPGLTHPTGEWRKITDGDAASLPALLRR